MAKKQDKPGSTEDADIEREARTNLQFSLAEAVLRNDSALLKGASPITRKRQAELAIEHFLEDHLDDAEGALSVVLPRRARESETLLAGGYEDPLRGLSLFIETLLGSQKVLHGFVHEIDAQWGRIYLERPFFEKEGRPAHRDDPYTLESVRLSLEQLLERLKQGSHGK